MLSLAKLIPRKQMLVLVLLPILMVTLNAHTENKLSTNIKQKKLVVFTDYEADDSVAIALLLRHLTTSQVDDTNRFIIGVLLGNQYRKKALAEELVRLFGYDIVAIYVGTGGLKEPFDEEGIDIHSCADIEKFHALDTHGDRENNFLVSQNNQLTEQFEHMLQSVDLNSVDVLVLTTPIDFVHTILKDTEHLYKINKIYMMGGWINDAPTFNWNLDLASVKHLLNLMDKNKSHPFSPELIIFSTHFFAREFKGYVNSNKFPEVITAFDKSKNSVVQHIRHMVKNWDDSMTLLKPEYTQAERTWRLAMIERIGQENIGRQFTPSDPTTVLGYLYPNSFILQKTPVKITFTLPLRGGENKNAHVEFSHDYSSNIFIVEKVDINFFNNKLVELMKYGDSKIEVDSRNSSNNSTI